MEKAAKAEEQQNLERLKLKRAREAEDWERRRTALNNKALVQQVNLHHVKQYLIFKAFLETSFVRCIN